MSVVISNITNPKNYGDDRQFYKVAIGEELIAIFEHTKKDGLAVLLKRAGEAVERRKHG